MVFRGLRDRLGAGFLGWVVCALVAAPAVAAEPTPVEAMYRPESLVEIDLDLPPASIAALELKPDEYQPATFALKAGAETYGPYSVGARLKGSVGSFRPLSEKAGFKVKFDEYVDEQTFFGLEKLTLNNMVQDPSMVHETLAYELFRSLGVPAPRTGYAFVRVNGDAYGVYLNLETLDLISLSRWFATTRHLYEGQVGLDVSPGAAPAFEVDEGKNSKREDLEALILAASDGDGDWSEGMATVGDLAEMARMWAVERYIGHWDGYAGADAELYRPNNYYLHSVESGLFQMLPWGTDQTWGARLEFGEPAGGLLFNDCIADGDCQALYVDALTELQEIVPSLEFDRQALCLAQRLAPWQAREDEERREYDAGEIEAGIAESRDFIAERPEELAEWLQAEAPEVGADEAPCEPTPPVDSPPSQPAAVVRQEPPIRALDSRPPIRLGRVAIGARSLKAQVNLPLPGQLSLEAWIGGDTSGQRACDGRARARSTGWVAISCRIFRSASERLESRSLQLTVRAVLTAGSGETQVSTRTVALPRR